jgi:hypothetical protein
MLRVPSDGIVAVDAASVAAVPAYEAALCAPAFHCWGLRPSACASRLAPGARLRFPLCRVAPQFRRAAGAVAAGGGLSLLMEGILSEHKAA